MGNIANGLNASSEAVTGRGVILTLQTVPGPAPCRSSSGSGTQEGRARPGCCPRHAAGPEIYGAPAGGASVYFLGRTRTRKQAQWQNRRLTVGRAVATCLKVLSFPSPPFPPVKLSPSPPRWRLFSRPLTRPCGLRRRAKNATPTPAAPQPGAL